MGAPGHNAAREILRDEPAAGQPRLLSWGHDCPVASALYFMRGRPLCCFAADPPQKTFPFPYTQEDLPNGLRLVTIPTDSPNLVSVFIVVQAGSRNEVEAGQDRLRAPVRTHDVPRHR